MKKLLLTFLTLCLLLAVGCNRQPRELTGEEVRLAIKDISACLGNKDNWLSDREFTGDVIAEFNTENETYAKEVVTKHKITIVNMYRLSIGGIKVKFKINENMPPKKICNFLNDKNIAEKYPNSIFYLT